MAEQIMPIKDSVSQKKLYVFIGGVFVFSIFSFWISNQEFFISMVQPLLNIYSKISSLILNIFGFDTTAQGEVLSGKEFSLEIKKGCDAIAPMILYTLSILFFPVAFKTKPKAIAVGIGLLFLLNVIRIVSLFITKKYFPGLFDFAHTDLWQILFIVFTLYLWLRWMKLQLDQPATNV